MLQSIRSGNSTAPIVCNRHDISLISNRLNTFLAVIPAVIPAVVPIEKLLTEQNASKLISKKSVPSFRFHVHETAP